MTNYLDEAFNWLVLLLSTIAAALTQFPQLVPLYQPGEGGSILVVRVLIVPILVLVILWLAGAMVRTMGPQVVLKSLSWTFASIVLAGDIALLLFGSVPLLRALFAGGQLGLLQAVVFLEVFIPIPFCLFIIRPKLRESYPDSKLLRSLPLLIILYVLAVILYVLSVGVVEVLLGIGPI